MAEAVQTDGLAGEISDHYLTCIICMDTYTQPKALPCLHSFCLKCLENWAQENDVSQSKPQVSCPSCQLCHTVPDITRGMASFPDNHILVSLLDTVKGQNTASSRNTNTAPSAPIGTPIIDPQEDSRANNAEQSVTALAQPGTIQKTFGVYGLSSTNFEKPIGMAITTDDHLAVADSRDNRIIIFTPAGEPRWVVKCKHEVKSISCCDDNFLVAVCKGGGVISHLYTKYGIKIQEKPEGLTHRYTIPSSMIMCKNNVVFTSTDNNNIQVLQDWKLIKTWTTVGHTNGCVCADVNDNVIFLDHDRNLGTLFSLEGKQLFTFGNIGLGKLSHPTHVCIDGPGNIIVADSDNYRIAVFSTKGKYLHDAVHDTGRLQGLKPYYVAWSASSWNLYVLVTGRHWAEVRIYKYDMNTASNRLSLTCQLQ